MPLGPKTLACVLVVLGAGCSRKAPDATPEGALRLWIETMESGESTREAYDLLGPRARANLKERAERASRGQGHRYEPHEMIAKGRFGLRFRPKSMTSRIEGDEAWVEVKGDGPGESASVHCVREGDAFRIEPELPELLAPPKRPEVGQ